MLFLWWCFGSESLLCEGSSHFLLGFGLVWSGLVSGLAWLVFGFLLFFCSVWLGLLPPSAWITGGVALVSCLCMEWGGWDKGDIDHFTGTWDSDGR